MNCPSFPIQIVNITDEIFLSEETTEAPGCHLAEINL